MRLSSVAILFLACAALARPQARLTTRDQVLDRYKQALGGVEAIESVQSETRHAEFDTPKGKATFVGYSKPFKGVQHITLADGTEISGGFDGKVSWQIRDGKASIDKETPVESDRRDSDLQYALHQPDYFEKYEFAGVTDFEGRPCYWLHGTTHWGKDNNQYYDVETGLLSGYKFQADQSDSKTVVIALFEDYKQFGPVKVATRQTTRVGQNSQTMIVKSVSYEPLDDSMFELPDAVKALLKQP